MLTYSFENIGKESIYEYLYKCIKKDIIEGRLVKGEHLHSKRTLAQTGQILEAFHLQHGLSL